LVFVGGLVRSTGSGMGCPDWPKCFGSFVPPTSINQLPADYSFSYNQYRKAKNEKFARFIEAFGLSETAQALRNDPEALEEEPFNATKTWIEYVNRLIGAVVGLILSALLVVSLMHSGKAKWYALAAWILVLITGWFGSIVVSSNLTPWTVSVHLGLAFAIVVLLTYCLNETNSVKEKLNINPSFALTMIGLLLTQIYLGVRVRSKIDLIAAHVDNRAGWIDSAGVEFIIHRSFSWLMLITTGYFAWQLIKIKQGRGPGISIIGLILSLIFSGTIMAYFGVPWLIQPLHLLFATLTLTLLFWTFLRSEKLK
jgi:cytochrome c oxidase assembly protein subunit 15